MSMRLAGALPAHARQGETGTSRHSRSKAPMHYYLQCGKKGSVFFTTNRPAFSSFPVNPNWIAPWLQSGKLEIPEARQQYVRCCRNLRCHLGNLETLTREREDELLAEKKSIITQALALELRRFKTVPCQSEFLAQFGRIQGRYKFLVLHGPSRTGKTWWARHLFQNPAVVLDVNCASCPEPDLRSFRPLVHRAILFDEGTPQMVLQQKKLFQCPNADVQLGCSTTNCHAYSVFVSGVALIIATNDWAALVAELPRSDDRDWLAANSFVEHVTTPLFD